MTDRYFCEHDTYLGRNCPECEAQHENALNNYREAEARRFAADALEAKDGRIAELEARNERLATEFRSLRGIQHALNKHIDAIEAENTELKREPYIQRQQAIYIAELEARIEELEAENTGLKAEIERIKELFRDAGGLLSDRCTRFEAENERLRTLLSECFEWMDDAAAPVLMLSKIRAAVEVDDAD